MSCIIDGKFIISCGCIIYAWLVVLYTALPKVDSAWSSGNYEEARRQSNIAKILNFIGIGIGIGVWSIFGIYVLAQIILVAAL